MDIRKPVPTNYGDWLTKFGEIWKEQVAKLKDRFGASIEEVRIPHEHPTDVPIVYVKPADCARVLSFLKTEPGFEYAFLADLSATDESPAEPRFEVVYNLLSHARMNRIRVKTRVREGQNVPTLVGVWKGANWAEREVWDMYGVRFEGHPDLRRILMDERWEGHPLRKDYPLRGYQVFPMAEEIDPKLLS